MFREEWREGRRAEEIYRGINNRVDVFPRAQLMTCPRVCLEVGAQSVGWKFKILAWQETNRRWDGPIANSFRAGNSSQPLSPSAIH